MAIQLFKAEEIDDHDEDDCSVIVTGCLTLCYQLCGIKPRTVF